MFDIFITSHVNDLYVEIELILEISELLDRITYFGVVILYIKIGIGKFIVSHIILLVIKYISI